MLFGHHNNEVHQPTSDPTPAVEVSPTLNPLAVDPTTGVSLPVVEDAQDVAQASPVAPMPLEPPTTLAGMPLPPPPAPVTPPPAPTTAPVPETSLDVAPEVIEPTPVVEPEVVTEPTPEPEPMPAVEPTPESIADSQPEPESAPAPIEEPTMPFDQPQPTEVAPVDVASPQPVAVSSLLDLKQHALAELTPLVDQLDQSPEERFRTKMMMIQSTDDQSLIQDAYESAQQITDEKVRAQALLDIINEINYFTGNQTN